MEHPMKFTRLVASYKRDEGILSGPAEISFSRVFWSTELSKEACANVECEVEIQQGPGRIIVITSGSPLYWGSLLALLSQVERLLMVFDGCFVAITDMRFSGSEGSRLPTAGDCASARSHALKSRLPYYRSADFMFCDAKLIDFRNVLSTGLFAKWQGILDDLEIVNQVYLYSVSDNGMPRDVSLAFLVEMAEPMVELLQAEQGVLPTLTPGTRDTSLKVCLRALISKYGSVIFRNEISSGLEDILGRLKGTRVQIMHIKRNWPEDKRLDGRHCVCYILKLSLLYRVVLLKLLGIEEEDYAPRVSLITGRLDHWAAQLDG